MRTKRRFVFLILFIITCFISIVYARLGMTLNIQSSAGFKAASWSVYFSSLTVSKTGDAEINNNPSIDNLIKINDFSVLLKSPGDSVTITFDVVNDGTIDAQITNFILGDLDVSFAGDNNAADDINTVKDNLTYKLMYTNTTTIEQTGEVIDAGSFVDVSQKLLAGQRVNLTMVLSYDGVSLPRDKVSISIKDTELNYSQYLSNS